MDSLVQTVKRRKFEGTEYEERIRLLDNLMKASEMGRDRNYYRGFWAYGSGINILRLILMETERN